MHYFCGRTIMAKSTVYGNWINAKKSLGWESSSSSPLGSVYGRMINAKRLGPVKLEGLVKNASLYSRIGGGTVISAWLRNFYGKALKDERIRKYFDFDDAVEMEQRIQRQIACVSAAIGGSSGPGVDLHSLVAQLKSLGLNDAHFDAVVVNLTATLQGQNVPTPLIKEMVDFCESIRKQVLG
jgi:hemoglobin